MIRGRKYSCWAALPNAIKTGATMRRETASCGGAPAAPRTGGRIFCWTTLLPPQPPLGAHFRGQFGIDEAPHVRPKRFLGGGVIQVHASVRMLRHAPGSTGS